MTARVPRTIPLPGLSKSLTPEGLQATQGDTLKTLAKFIPQITLRLNDVLPKDGTEPMTGPLDLGSFSLTNATLDASLLTSGTIPDARFPATLPAVSGANLTNLNASALTSGTVAVERLPTPLVCRVHKNNVNQSITGNTATKVTFSTATFDTASWFDNANDRITVDRTGYYRITAQVYYTSGIASGNFVLAYLYVNGALRMEAVQHAAAAVDTATLATDVFFLNTSDYVELYAYKGGSNSTIYGPSKDTFLTVEFLGA